MTEIDYLHHFEGKLVRHAAPTLAGIKPACLFTFNHVPQNEMPVGYTFEQMLEELCVRLEGHGVKVRILADRARGPLLYVYRPALVRESLANRETTRFLSSMGYRTKSIESCLDVLEERIGRFDREPSDSGKCRFPHEIGLFLGYPFDDVIGFIENEGRGCKDSGCWKVYSNERDARDCFCRYREATIRLDRAYADGHALESLLAG